MSLELDDMTGIAAGPGGDAAPERRRPNVAGDLPTVLGAGPLFGRAVAGYDRFQVDTYVQWAEEELAAAEREIDRLVTRHLSTQAALDEARELLHHSAGGGQLLQVSRRIGGLLATAADEADDIRAEARAERAAAAADARRLLARADETMVAAQAGARRLSADAAADAEAVTGRAHRLLAEAEESRREGRAEAAALRDRARLVERQALAHAERVRRAATEEAGAALLRARAEAVALLDTAREQRRRADAAAAVARDRLDREAAARRTALVAEVESLERHRAALAAQVGRLAARRGPSAAPPRNGLRSLVARLRYPSGAVPAS